MVVTWLKAKRLEKEYSLNDLEKLTGLDYSYLSKIERYQIYPSEDALQRYINALEITRDEFETAFRERKISLIRTVIQT